MATRIGRYLNGSSNFSLVSNYPALGGVTTQALANNVLINPTVEWGGEVGYQHRWLPNLRSNINMGIIHHDISSRAAGCRASRRRPWPAPALAA